ncbi:MAG: hypothetical protein CL840_21450 [Crocinitomicaceae bacterium]|nr:hypothetical protein [Crocinitomicaceae bacterium]|tara:strand:+ start:16140 stop:16970 length:831 start_codon:yes stop_codon:yes gene_type:complete
MKQIYILTILSLFTCANVSAQSTEDFETETVNATSFTDNGQSFTIGSIAPGDTCEIATFSGAGWNGTKADEKYIDNSISDSDYDGASYFISTTDGKNFVVKSLYLFVSTTDIHNPTSTTLTIEGKKKGASVFTITKDTGFSNVETLTPNNGYTFIDFSSEGGTDNSNKDIDELIFTTTNSADYLALDAFTWDVSKTSSTYDVKASGTLKFFPNPTKEFIQVSGLTAIENYKIYNILGTEMDNGMVSDNEKIEVKNLPNGVYFLKFENGNTLRFIKE